MSKQVFTGGHPLPFSNMIVQNGTAYVAGQVGFDSQDKLADNIEEQTRQTIENLKNLLKEGGYDLSDVVRVGAFLVSRDDFPGFNKIYAEYFKKDKPVRTTIFTQLAKDDFLVEIDAIAVK
jgi:2-iminobutanoate/2-iminopropanoate deaminase